MYDLSGVFGLAEVSGLEPGSSLLVADTDGTDATDWVLGALGSGLQASEGAVLVSMGQPAAVAVDALEAHGPVEPQAVCVIDCQGSERARRTLDNGVFVYSVPKPDDLTGIGIGLAACVDRLTAAGYDRTRVGFHSLSPVLDAAGDEAAFKFAHVVSSRLGAAGFLGVFGLEHPHTPESKRILTEAFDQTLELKTSTEGVEGRVRERQGDPSAWQPLP